MTTETEHKDLVVLVADKNMEFAVKGLLARYHSFRVRQISCDIYQHPHRDTGCLREGHTFLQSFASSYDHAFVMLDHDGCGQEDLPRERLELEIEGRLAQSGWDDRAAALVIAPELEIWVWNDSPHVARELGWQRTQQELREWLVAEGFLATLQQIKPHNPKEAVESVMRLGGKSRSSALFKALAPKVSLNKCADPAFLKLKNKLKDWFS
jgi:hypothetical protein